RAAPDALPAHRSDEGRNALRQRRALPRAGARPRRARRLQGARSTRGGGAGAQGTAPRHHQRHQPRASHSGRRRLDRRRHHARRRDRLALPERPAPGRRTAAEHATHERQQHPDQPHRRGRPERGAGQGCGSQRQELQSELPLPRAGAPGIAAGPRRDERSDAADAAAAIGDKNMKRLIFTILAATLIAAPTFAQSVRNLEFASDSQTIPVMGNTPGAFGATFQTYVALLNPTSSAFTIQAALWDGNGVEHDASITLAAGQLRTFQNFLAEVFNVTGGGAVTLKASETAGGTHNNRFIVSTEVRTSGTHYSTTIPALEFAGSNSRSFVAGVTVDSSTRTNVGCFNQSSVANSVKVTVLDSTGAQTVGTTTLNLAANGWGQTGISSVVSNGYVQFDPAEATVCYAVVVDNTTSDGRFISAIEYRP